jgi:hypothetical protein
MNENPVEKCHHTRHLLQFHAGLLQRFTHAQQLGLHLLLLRFQPDLISLRRMSKSPSRKEASSAKYLQLLKLLHPVAEEHFVAVVVVILAASVSKLQRPSTACRRATCSNPALRRRRTATRWRMIPARVLNAHDAHTERE